MGWSQRLFGSLWRVLSKEVKQHVGTDQLGNKYYYIPEYKNWRGQTIREKRIVEAAQKKEVDYETGDIPAEWEAWIRRMRKIPPTMEKKKIRTFQLYPLKRPSSSHSSVAINISSQIMDVKHHFPLEGTRAPRRSHWLQI
ncbi:NADH dehydrogenase [ubiquinone] 1 alpha subcomplex assembly factor 2 isoform X2 [Loxodonta africana]|uniref:NADH dehydrogenase [ubiquinone] 1 alpha subcomplex assembly factor 2 isoform X2 n=1 Tax=Loxodonta africana TaxID=9785 RepID=UPI000C8143C9|nr:NADH dehydrogenase [ubiquinone] 1 alpha subcomplex assembly factor 2 isoform X2 [Loxodonta africana]